MIPQPFHSSFPSSAVLFFYMHLFSVDYFPNEYRMPKKCFGANWNDKIEKINKLDDPYGLDSIIKWMAANGIG